MDVSTGEAGEASGTARGSVERLLQNWLEFRKDRTKLQPCFWRLIRSRLVSTERGCYRQQHLEQIEGFAESEIQISKGILPRIALSHYYNYSQNLRNNNGQQPHFGYENDIAFHSMLTLHNSLNRL